MELRPFDQTMELPVAQQKELLPPAMSSEFVALSEDEVEFFSALVQVDHWQENRDRSGLSRSKYRERVSAGLQFVDELTQLSNVVVGAASKLHPILREQRIKELLGPWLVQNREDKDQLDRHAPVLAEYTRMIDVFQRTAEEQIVPAVSAVTDEFDQYQLINRFIEDDDEEINDAFIKKFVWNSAFFFAYGGYGDHEPLLDQLEERLTNGDFDSYITKELLDSTEPIEEIRRMQELAQHMSGNTADWQQRLLDRIDLFPAAVQKQIFEQRQAIGKNLRDNIDFLDSSYGYILRGMHGDLNVEFKSVHEAFRQKRLRKIGKTVVQNDAPPQSIRRRWKDTDAVKSEVESDSEIESTRQILNISDKVYDYKQAETSDRTVLELLEKYAGNNSKLLEALLECPVHIAERYGRAERANGIKSVRSSANKPEKLWEFKPQDAVNIGQVGRAIDQTRLLFVVKDDTIHIVDVFERPKYNETMKNLGLGR